MYTYTLGFIKQDNHILMINRNKKPWQGCWNGLGGKLIEGESPLEGMVREIREETGLDVSSQRIKDCGILTWNTFEASGQGLYLFLIDWDQQVRIDTPLHTTEGILDWKPIDWILDFDTIGVAHNIPYFLPHLLRSETRYHFHCIFEDKRLIKVTKELL